MNSKISEIKDGFGEGRKLLVWYLDDCLGFLYVILLLFIVIDLVYVE